MSGVVVHSERDSLARELLAFASTHAASLGPCYAVVLGAQAAARAEAYQRWVAGQVFTGESADLAEEAVAQILARLTEQLQAEVVLLGATRRGRSLAPRLAQMLDAGCVSEATGLALEEGQLTTTRLALGGNTRARERITTARKVIAAAPGAAAAAAGGEQTAVSAEIAQLPFEPPPARTRLVRRDPKPPADADIAQSERLVCIGRGLSREEDLPLVQDLADALGAEVACTRPLSYEYAWLPEERMIGISGVRTNPRLMLSLGVSGQVQHTVGMAGSKVIVAVNREPSAPIFKLADYGIVGDLYQVAPKLAERLRDRAKR